MKEINTSLTLPLKSMELEYNHASCMEENTALYVTCTCLTSVPQFNVFTIKAKLMNSRLDILKTELILGTSLRCSIKSSYHSEGPSENNNLWI